MDDDEWKTCQFSSNVEKILERAFVCSFSTFGEPRSSVRFRVSILESRPMKSLGQPTHPWAG